MWLAAGTWSIEPVSRFSTSIAEAIFSAFAASMPRRAPNCRRPKRLRRGGRWRVLVGAGSGRGQRGGYARTCSNEMLR